jgi:hypothetical protein
MNRQQQFEIMFEYFQAPYPTYDKELREKTKYLEDLKTVFTEKHLQYVIENWKELYNSWASTGEDIQVISEKKLLPEELVRYTIFYILKRDIKKLKQQ